jgi:hypothetical protein
MHKDTLTSDHHLIEYQARAAMLKPVPLALVDWKRPAAKPKEAAVVAKAAAVAARIVDLTIEGSFPASDPPSWNPGVARPAPVRLPASKAAGQ